ncbi:MAG: hypothetical protein KBS41_05925, partial [Oscillospiraceae bacterium]|nr:hypothetical protein [Candidatus Equicaccousia limihippi]
CAHSLQLLCLRCDLYDNLPVGFDHPSSPTSPFMARGTRVCAKNFVCYMGIAGRRKTKGF